MRTKNFLTTMAFALVTALNLAGCGLVYDDEEDCVEAEPTSYTVRFRYDMNMKFADAFAHEVHSVQLYVLDDHNNLVWKGEEHDHPTLEAEGYEMTIPAEKITPGNSYNLLAWCGSKHLDDCSCYTIDSSSRATDGIMADLEYDIPDEQVVQDSIDNLYHGLVKNVLFPKAEGKQRVATIPLTKDTNRFVIVLQHLSGRAIGRDDFSFRIEANNQLLSQENEIVVHDEAQAIDQDNGLEYDVEYRPWAIATASADMSGHISLSDGEAVATDESYSEDGVLNVVVAELTVNRLVVEDDPRLIVTNNTTGDVVFDIPVKDYALMVKGRENQDMSDQEYLDRQDEYNMTFFLDERDRWFSTYIYINSWRVVLQNSAL
jgi:hypothetical protein